MIKGYTYLKDIKNRTNPTVSWSNYPRAQSIRVSVIQNDTDFKALKENWNSLLDKSREPHPFLSWEWQYTWWEQFKNLKDVLMIIIISDGNEIIAIAPFYIKQTFFSKTLMLIGEGEPINSHVASHYHDIICREKDSQLVMSHITSFLKEHQSWDYCSFSYVLNESYLFSIMEQINPLLSIKIPFGHQYRIHLGDDFNTKFQSYSKSTKKRFRLKRNRMEKVAKLKLISLDLEDNILGSVDILEKLHGYRQFTKGENSAFFDPAFKQFHLALLERLRGTNKAQLRALIHGDEIIACVLNYVSVTALKPIIYSYTTGFKSTDDKRFSPMFVFDILDFEYSTEQGYSEYDLLSADGDVSYKSTYKPSTQPVSKLCWFSISPLGINAYLYVKLRRLVSKGCYVLKIKR